MKFKQHIKKILAVILIWYFILSSLLPICNISFAADGDKTGNTAKINLKKEYNYNLDMWRYEKGGVFFENLYCAEKYGNLGTQRKTTVDEYNWNANAGIFKDEISYKKITWIKNNFWEYIGQDEKNKYTIDEKYKILNAQNSEITKADIEAVFNNNDEIFRLYQIITWTYTKTQNDKSFNIEDKIAHASVSAQKIYRTIIGMADKYYESFETNPNIDVKETSAITKVTNGECSWGIEVTNTSILPYTITVNVNNQPTDNYTYENNKLTIKGLDDNETYSFNVSVKSAYVKADATVWISERNKDDQNMLEITDAKRYEINDSISANVEGTKEGMFKLLVEKTDFEGNPLNDVVFDITGEVTKPITTRNG